MMLPKIDKNLVYGVGGLALVGVAVYLFFKREVQQGASAAADFAGGVLSGNNALTQGTVYEDRGVLGTLGSAANEVSGGVLENFGSWLGGKIFDLTNDTSSVTARTPAFAPRSVQVRKTAGALENLIGP